MVPDKKEQICPLCGGTGVEDFFRNGNRDYFLCPVCRLVFVPSSQFLAAEEEKTQYDLHQNSPDDAGYRQFLSRLFVPMKETLQVPSRGLDFGSGPGPTLSVMFQEVGHSVSLYDRFYQDEPSVFARQYDFITATEVLEHLHHPRRELERIWACLKPGGCLGIMTKLWADREAFARWHYKNDPTHVSFYCRATMRWLAVKWQGVLQFVAKDAMIFRKSG